MPRRNRVTPWGDLVAVSARGEVMGNRGVLVDARGEPTRRRWTTRGWIACAIDFQGRKRDPAPPGRWTALFFLDDASALAAGHRPCGFCRRADYGRFKSAWESVHGAAHARDIDARLHPQRTAPQGDVEPRTLPDGAFVGDRDACFRIERGRGRAWSWQGYGAPVDLPRLPLITPRAIVRVLEAGYRPRS